MGKNFKILCLDGGGIRGLYAAVILKKTQETFDIKLKNEFDLIAGTSTGSILAGALVCDIHLDTVIELYETKGKEIFSKNLFGYVGAFRSKYSNKGLIKNINDIFKDIKLGDIKKPLMIIASDILNGSVYVHKSNYLPSEEYSRDGDTKLSEAIVSSCSAPTFFNPFKMKNDYLLADGGLWANNPSIIALTEAISKERSNRNVNDFKILSIGTGAPKISYTKSKKFWGFISGWESSKLIEYILELSVLSSANMCQLILKDNYLRVSGAVEHKMDDLKNLSNLKAFADKCFLDNAEKIENFIKAD